MVTEKKKIIGLSCGKPKGHCETYISAAAMGASEFGVETEIIRATQLNVNPCRGCGACVSSAESDTPHSGKCAIKDDVDWILRKTVLSDAALIVAAPVFYLRPNGYLMCINERMHPIMFGNLDILKKKKVGAIISHGGSPYDWACLSLPSINIWTQHFMRLVDQVHIGGGEPDDPEARAIELGRNVAKAMIMPIEEVKYVGDESPVSCPVCHCDIMHTNEGSPHVVCPVCWIHGEISLDNGKMSVKWDEWDVEYPRFSEYGVFEHMGMGNPKERWKFESSAKRWKQMEGTNHKEEIKKLMRMLKEMNKKYAPYGKIINPH